MGNNIKSLGEVHDYDICLFPKIKRLHKIMDCLNQLGVAGVFGSETMLPICENVEIIQM